jgi:hypothetical protein
VKAYENGDLVRIRIISEAVADPKEIIEANTSLELNKEKKAGKADKNHTRGHRGN